MLLRQVEPAEPCERHPRVPDDEVILWSSAPGPIPDGKIEGLAPPFREHIDRIVEGVWRPIGRPAGATARVRPPWSLILVPADPHGLLDIREGDHHRHRIDRRLRKAVVNVEAFRLLRNGVQQDRADAHGFGHGERSQECISEERGTEASPLMRPIDGQPNEDHDRDRLRHVAPHPASGDGVSDGAGGQGVVADDTAATDYHERPRGTGTLVLQCSALQPVVQLRNSAFEGRNVVLAGEMLRRGAVPNTQPILDFSISGLRDAPRIAQSVPVEA